MNQHQYGGALGGPIIKDKLLFFVSFQETRQKNGTAAGSLSSPNLPVIPTGDRSTQTWLNAMYAIYCNKKEGSGAVLLANPTVPCANPFPAGLNATTQANVPINPVALSILRLKFADGSYYIPSTPGPQSISVPATYVEHQPIVNFDYIISPKHTLSTRYFYSIDPQTVSFPANNTSLPGFPNTRRWTNETALVKLTSVLTNNFINEVRGSYQRYITNSTGTPPFTKTDVGMGLLGSRRIDLPQIVVSSPGFTIGQFIFGGAHIVTNQYQAADQVSWTHGKHTLRGGFEYNYNKRFYDFNALQIGGISINTFQDF